MRQEFPISDFQQRSRTSSRYLQKATPFAEPLSPQSQSFFRRYGSILPNSLIYILLVDQRLLTLETWCGCWYDLACSLDSPSDFHGSSYTHLTFLRVECSTCFRPYLWIIQFHGLRQLRRKENSSRSIRWCLRARLCYHTVPTTSLRNINLIPFRLRRLTLHFKRFRLVLGSSNPWPIAVLMEPFSTSAFKVLIWIIATTTKICTRNSSTKVHTKASTLSPRPLTQQCTTSNVGRVSASQYSAIHFQGWLIWLVSGKHSLPDTCS